MENTIKMKIKEREEYICGIVGHCGLSLSVLNAYSD